MVVCGVCAENDIALKELGVRDSKKLSPKKREELAPKIRALAKVEVVEVTAEEIDEMREMMTMNELEARVFATIIERLGPKVAYVDSADANEAQFARMIQTQLKLPVDIVSKHKADDLFPVVSAASIVAKVTRDGRIAEIERAIGEPIGTGYPSDPDTIAFLRKYCERNKCLPPHTRTSWVTAKNLMRMHELRRLDSYEG